MSVVPTSALDDLHALGWKVRTAWEIDKAVRNFQAGYALGPALTVDGVCGPMTAAALDKARAQGGRLSEHFTAREFQCHCRQTYSGCEGIKVKRAVLLAAETTRDALYPGGMTVVSGYRCKRHNAAVGGATSSQHLLGNAMDVTPVAGTAAFAKLDVWTGIGYSPSNHPGKVIHVDRRSGISVQRPLIFPDGR